MCLACVRTTAVTRPVRAKNDRAADGTGHREAGGAWNQNQGTWRHLEPPQLIARTIP